ncbi:hypothetical protein COB21_00375 [Candidatus Aerophobetes bacterium]|uniref:Uncharacterized protein n=1 Tax=Aerophobetes bacterium TaxID=2030807 RepID=A0A2A4X7H4_UNCAE|nr:MAG: hypothetical protein COB21_00375 [Candidatus Aerophobetes bacterium]
MVSVLSCDGSAVRNVSVAVCVQVNDGESRVQSICSRVQSGWDAFSTECGKVRDSLVENAPEILYGLGRATLLVLEILANRREYSPKIALEMDLRRYFNEDNPRIHRYGPIGSWNLARCERRLTRDIRAINDKLFFPSCCLSERKNNIRSQRAEAQILVNRIRGCRGLRSPYYYY